jgi:carboxyl-terminal processing protease
VNNTLKYVFAALVVIVLVLGSFAGGFVTGHLLPYAGLPGMPGLQEPITSVPPTTSPEQKAATPAEFQTLFSPFWEAWTLVHKNFVNQPVDDVALMRGAISGMMQALGDKHSTYMDPTNFEQANAGLEGEYEGIGAYVDTTTEYLTITSPMPGSPAERAGLLPGDQVVAVDGEDMTGIIAEIARTKVIGPEGTTVHLTILREGEGKLLEFDVVRKKIVLNSATGKMLENDIAYIQVTTFGAKTTPELLATLTELMAKNPKGIILDLRNNGGGYLQTSVEVTSQFVGKGVVLYEQYGDGTRITYDVNPGGMATDTNIPMVVLINEGSASASEIVAGALQDHGRAKLLGATSYGKGSVQNWIPLSGDNGAVRITIAKWLTPNENTIHEIGLTPDVVAELTEEDYKAKRDPQLDAAVEFLSSTIAGTPYVYEAPPSTEPTPTEPTPTEPVPTEPVSSVVECSLAMPAHLTSGKSATVIKYLYLRSSPGIGNNWLQTINPNTQVEVMGNPTCVLHGNGAYIWWQVKLPDGAVGWLAEGSFTRKLYFLEPVK